jgi:hypothetical protein
VTPSDDFETDRLGRRAEPATSRDPSEVPPPVALDTPEGAELWEKLKHLPPVTVVTHEEYLEILARQATSDDAAVGSGTLGVIGRGPSGEPPSRAEPTRAGCDDVQTGEQHVEPAAAPVPVTTWPLPSSQGERRLAARRLSGRGSLDAPTDD